MPRPSRREEQRKELLPILARAFADLGFRRATTAELARRWAASLAIPCHPSGLPADDEGAVMNSTNPTLDSRPGRRPLVPVVCRGTPGEIGFQQGRALADLVAGSSAVLADLEALRLAKPRWMPLPVFRRIAERRAGAAWKKGLTTSAPVMDERLRGIARGSGMRPGALRLLNVLEPVLSDLGHQTRIPPLGGCSAVAVSGGRSADGRPMLARNFDYLPSIQPFYALRDVRPGHGLRSLDFTVAPLAGTVDGVNEAGLCIACNYAYVTDPATPARTVTMAVAEALARCTSVAGAAEHLAEGPRWGGGLLMLADAAGDIASLELSNTRSHLRRDEEGRGVLFHTNRFQSPRMREVELHPRAVFTRRAPRPLRGTVVHRSADRRHGRLGDLLAGDRPVGRDDLVQILADHGPEGVPSADTLCMHSDYWHTTATLQLFPATREVRVAFDPACRARFTGLAAFC